MTYGIKREVFSCSRFEVEVLSSLDREELLNVIEREREREGERERCDG